jgi:hypothetical protein
MRSAKTLASLVQAAAPGLRESLIDRLGTAGRSHLVGRSGLARVLVPGVPGAPQAPWHHCVAIWVARGDPAEVPATALSPPLPSPPVSDSLLKPEPWLWVAIGCPAGVRTITTDLKAAVAAKIPGEQVGCSASSTIGVEHLVHAAWS